MTVFGKTEDKLLTGTGARPYISVIDGARCFAATEFGSSRFGSGYGGLVVKPGR
jgi:hypothetical protein